MSHSGALAGLVVVDLSQFLSGPYATQVLGSMGAEVVKVEPLKGDSSRVMPPYYFNEESGYYLSTNRNKRSIAVDLKTAEGKEIVLNLIRRADVVLSNFRPGVLERLGLGFDVLQTVKEDIILCSITGFGETGPYRDRPAYDMVVQALSGIMSLTGEEDGEPVRAGVPIGDLVAGLYANISILSALWTRDRTGKGQKIDVSMFDSQISLLSYLAVYYLLSGDVPGPQGKGHVSIPTYRSFVGSDKNPVVITANTEAMWQKLCVAIDCPQLLEIEKFQTNQKRLENKDALWPILDEAFAKRPASEWADLLNAAGVPAAPVNTVDVALHDPHSQARNMVQDVEHTLGGIIQLIGNPIKMGVTDPPMQSPPVLGQDTVNLLSELGYGSDQIKQLLVNKVVLQHEGGMKHGS